MRLPNICESIFMGDDGVEDLRTTQVAGGWFRCLSLPRSIAAAIRQGIKKPRTWRGSESKQTGDYQLDR